jgi:MoaA/NifB/PqqE/SkfB family radical SAM enzyme
MSTLGLLSKVPMYMSFRRWGWPKLLPFSLVISVCYRCNSRCRTCNVWKKQAEELTLEEWDRVFANIGRTPYYLTFTGGEPFLRRDLVDLVGSAYQHCHPGVITLPTNGLLSDLIPEKVEQLLQVAPNSKLGVNLSLDGIGERHDAIRGVPDNYERALKTYRALKSIHHPNLTLSLHTVISRFNANDIPEIYEELAVLEPDSYITEIAEERAELDTVGLDITPDVEDYERAVDFLSERLRDQKFGGISKVTQAFRRRYYDLVKNILRERRQVVPCYAGWASGHISPDGDVWTCCIRAEPIGNLRETEYDLRPIWFGPQAETLRQDIRGGGCYCPMANASYTNMFLHAPTLVRVALQTLR